MTQQISASVLYDLVQCPKRVELDLFGDPSKRDESSAFVRMLWERGALFEQEVMRGRGNTFLDLSGHEAGETERLTLEAMRRGEPLIYSGRISADDLVGVPDLLRFNGNGYVPIDIKSGRAEEGGSDDGDDRPKLHYAVQLALYVDILERIGLAAGRRAAILDVDGHEVAYHFDRPRTATGNETLWEEYSGYLGQARAIASRAAAQSAAASSMCKLCHWCTLCASELKESDDLTLIPSLGRAVRDSLAPVVGGVADFAKCDPELFIDKKKTRFRGVGPERLRKFHARAKLLSIPGSQPYLTAPLRLPSSETEFFFDIEVDPMRDFTYLHGIIERVGGNNETEKFTAFFADEISPGAEERAFAESVAFLNSIPTASIWYYSKYERTIYRKLQARFPNACSVEDVERIFDPARAVDLYSDVVVKATEWPTNDHSIKTLAKYLGFSWRDTNPSGAASIEWFDRWARERDPAVKARILDYNEDDCRATRVLLDGIRAIAGGTL